MDNKYDLYASKMKSLTDSNRLMIIDMLSCGELCACEILEKLHITQPTLSHHMRILCDSNLVMCRREGKNIFYKLNNNEISLIKAFLNSIFTATEDCICL